MSVMQNGENEMVGMIKKYDIQVGKTYRRKDQHSTWAKVERIDGRVVWCSCSDGHRRPLNDNDLAEFFEIVET